MKPLRILLAIAIVIVLTLATVSVAHAGEFAAWSHGYPGDTTAHPDVSKSVKTFYFAEGSLREGFQPYLLLFNPDESVADTTIVIYWTDGSIWWSRGQVNGRQTIDLYDLLCPMWFPEVPDFSIGVFSDDPTFYAERSQFWQSPDGNRIGTGWSPSQPGTRFVFAEGCTAYGFETYLTILNPAPSATRCHVSLSGASSTVTIPVSPYSRVTLNLGDLVSSDVSAVVTADTPVVVERVMYSPGRSAGYVTGGQK